MIKKIVFILSFFMSTAVFASVKVVDGDSLELNGKKIRLLGIDAPEYFQECYDHFQNPYFCGQKAKDFLKQKIDQLHKKGLKIKCSKKGTDRYKRNLSICHAENEDINEYMVKNGWAVAYKHDLYKKAESKAKKKKRGIWQGDFMRPELYRILERYKENQKNITKS